MSIKNFSFNELKEPRYIFTSLVSYEQNGVKKTWEIVKAHDSVAILLYHKEKNSFILVKQFRPAVYANSHKDGYTLELCAGLIDKDLDLIDIAREEIEEECGFRVGNEGITQIASFYTSVGFAGSRQMLYYAEVDESMKVNDGGGVDDEFIELVYLDVAGAKNVIFDDEVVKTPGLMFAFMWWIENHGIKQVQ